MVDQPDHHDDEEPPVDPVRSNVETTMTEVDALRKQIGGVVEVSAWMEQRLSDMDNIRAQLSALLKHSGIEVGLKAPTPVPVTVFAATASANGL